MRLRAVLALSLSLLAACSSASVDAPSTTARTAGTTVGSAADPDPWSMPDHRAPSGPAPLGSGPSFTESPGCAGPQGIRGPYATAAGYLDDPVAIGGPWGDFFGRSLAEVRSHLVPMELPNGDDPPVTVYVHERVAPALQLVIDNLLREQAQGNVYHLDPAQVSSFYPATIPPKRYMSFHAMGMAIDINSRINEYREDNVLVTDLPPWFIRAWTDAGWCWGGYWQDLKDAMHFSWKGPHRTPGYPVTAPMPVETAAAGFDRSFRFVTGLGAPSQRGAALVGDLDRDGAADVVQLVPQAGGMGVTVAVAIHGFMSCWIAGPTPYPVPADATAALADMDGDARPDLVVVGPDADTVSIVAFTHASGFTAHSPVVRTAIAAPRGASYLVADLDRNGVGDLWQVVPGGPGAVSVWAGPDFTNLLATGGVSADASARFAVGDRDGDGVPDLFVLEPDELVVLDGASSFANQEHIATPAADRPGTVQAGDFDGDGRDDLYVLGDDGVVTVYLGGERGGTDDAGLMSWFLQGDDQPWVAWEACPVDGLGRR